MVIPVLVDTNFLTVPHQFSVDIFSETRMILEQRVEFLILDSVLREINQLAETSKGNDRIAFRVALELVENCKIIDLESPISELPVDDQLIELSVQMGAVLATNDRDLKTRARTRSIPVLFLRGKKRLDLEGEVS